MVVARPIYFFYNFGKKGKSEREASKTKGKLLQTLKGYL